MRKKVRPRLTDWQFGALVLGIIAFLIYTFIADWRDFFRGEVSYTFVDTLKETLWLVLFLSLALMVMAFEAWDWIRVHVLRQEPLPRNEPRKARRNKTCDAANARRPP